MVNFFKKWETFFWHQRLFFCWKSAEQIKFLEVFSQLSEMWLALIWQITLKTLFLSSYLKRKFTLGLLVNIILQIKLCLLDVFVRLVSRIVAESHEAGWQKYSCYTLIHTRLRQSYHATHKSDKTQFYLLLAGTL